MRRFRDIQGENHQTLEAKALQLERDVTFLWQRQCSFQKGASVCATTSALNVVAYAGIATPIDGAAVLLAEMPKKSKSFSVAL